MRVDEVREKSTDDLREELDESYRELMNLRFRWMTHQLPSVSEMKQVKKTIARIKTVMRERELGIH
ncbi:MAG: 50S ribosomal protein L29 [Chloroflexota bacterium]|nr:50S ribosomal protein L29 [Chloroflexota bacterium]MDE2900402.1 50S ribosomal protein L29 [Chloroflexota bacterium]MDE2970569.1 50S ribosomal protein L29 [Chloroflexota bacterium]